LYDLTQELLAASLFLGEQIKAETRRIATEFGLKTADKPESQDLCLVETHGSMQSFLDKYTHPKRILLTQAGYWGNTMAFIITRLVSGRDWDCAQPLYVIGLDAGRNRVIVGDRTSASQLECTVQRDQLGNDSQTSCPDPRGSASALSLPGCPSDGGSLDNARVKLRFDEPQFSITVKQLFGTTVTWFWAAESLKTDKLVHD